MSSGGTASTKVLWSGTANQIGSVMNLNDSINNYTIVFILGSLWYATSYLISSAFPATNTYYAIYINSRSYSIAKTSSTQFKITNRADGSDDDSIKQIIGLKLYYSFSYNIIYKILLRKISRLCQKFTLLKRKECEIIWV